ncbi:hypothetical protein ACLESO_22215 [Pyxidicoccus sp. 3LG]
MKTIVRLNRRADADAEHLARLSKAELLAVWQGMAAGTVSLFPFRLRRCLSRRARLFRLLPCPT